MTNPVHVLFFFIGIVAVGFVTGFVTSWAYHRWS